MKFPMIIHKSEDSDFSGVLPDFPGCYPSSETLDGLLANVQDAVETWMIGEDPEIFPTSSKLQDVVLSDAAAGHAVVLADVDTAFLDQETVRISMSVPRYLLKKIDKASKQAGKTRSGFLVESALAQIA